MLRLTEKLLHQLDACDAGIEFCNKFNLFGFPIDRLHEIDGDFKEYIEWLRSFDYDSFKFDDNGNLISFLQNKTLYQRVYDQYNNLIEIIYPVGNRVKYEYDEQHRLIKTEHISNDQFPPEIISHSYNFKGLLDRIIYSDNSYYQYTYDDCDNLIEYRHHIVCEKIKPIHNEDYVIISTYNSNNMLLTKKTSLGHKEQYTYDDQNNILKVLHGKGLENSIIYKYSNDNRLLSEQHFIDACMIKLITYDYYDDGQLRCLISKFSTLTIPWFNKNEI